MLEWIGDMIETLVEGIVSLVAGVSDLLTYLYQMIEDIVWLSTHLGSINNGIASWLGFLPPIVTVFIILCVSIAVIFKILGRE